MKTDCDIDFVIPWVDGSDPEWLAEFNKYAPTEQRRDIDRSEKRYRDYGLLRYWFRGVEKFAPWVNKVHFITCGQKPAWLNLAAPKLHWVRHSDYIPAEYLPVFSANPIELMMHRIPGLAEQIVYFNDDFFLTAPVRKNFFFRNGLPCDSAVMNALSATGMGRIVFNDLFCINAFFDRNKVIKRNWTKWLHPVYGRSLFRTLCLLPWRLFTGFYDPHWAVPYQKKTLEEVWAAFPEILGSTMRSRFRSDSDVNQWLFRYWQLCKGEFAPVSPCKGKAYFDMTYPVEQICRAIRDRNIKEIVLNDNDVPDFAIKMEKIRQAFESILPEKSSFEL